MKGDPQFGKSKHSVLTKKEENLLYTGMYFAVMLFKL